MGAPSFTNEVKTTVVVVFDKVGVSSSNGKVDVLYFNGKEEAKNKSK